MFIEYHGHWSHGGFPFVQGEHKSMTQLLRWQEKAKEYNVEENKNSFLVSIKGWTVKDVEKRTLAKINHLNFKEFFNLKQFYSWFNSL